MDAIKDKLVNNNRIVNLGQNMMGIQQKKEGFPSLQYDVAVQTKEISLCIFQNTNDDNSFT